MVFDILVSCIFILIGFNIATKVNISAKNKKMLTKLWWYHLVFVIFWGIYFGYTGDAFGYWLHTQQMSQADFIDSLFSGQGTEFMNALNYIPANLMRMGFFANTLLYGLLGFIAFTFLYRICIQTIPYNSKFYKYRLFPLLLFLPNLHFWSSGVGKDTILFLCILMVAYGLMRISKRFLLVMIGLLLSYGIRPHITLMLVVSFGLAYIINGKLSMFKRISLLIPLIAIAVFILPPVLEFVKMDELSMNELEQFSERKSTALSAAGSSVDISSYPYPLKVLTFLYRPFFFDINGIPAVIASFENLLLLLLSIQVIRNRFVATFKAAPVVIQGLFIFFILGALILSMSMSNLGIILRQRNMFLPGLIVFILWSFSYQQQQRIQNT